MLCRHVPSPGAFCWLDLAATDAAAAVAFYEQAFGWTFREQAANGGRFLRWSAPGGQAGSLYQLGRRQREGGVPSHWTPYLHVDDADDAVRRVAGCGGQTRVAPFEVDGTARIALIEDAAGALLGRAFA